MYLITYPPGNYKVITKDVNGCTAQSSSIAIPTTNGPTLNFTSSNTTCSLNNGTLSATASGGTGQYLLFN